MSWDALICCDIIFCVHVQAKDVYTAVLGAKHKETLNIVETLDIIAGLGESRTGTRPIFKTTV